MNVAELKPGDRVDSYTIELISQSGLNGEFEAVVKFDDGRRDRVEFPADCATRCAAVDDGTRCQLANHDGEKHAAMVWQPPNYSDTSMKTWPATWKPGKTGWADSFPRVENDPPMTFTP